MNKNEKDRQKKKKVQKDLNTVVIDICKKSQEIRSKLAKKQNSR